MSDSDRLDKNLQIAALNQKIEALQLQLSGTQKRANELANEIRTLTAVVAERDSQIQMLQQQLRTANAALDAMGREIRESRTEQAVHQPRTRPAQESSDTERRVEQAIADVKEAKDRVRKLSEAITRVLRDEEGAREALRQALLDFGDPKYRMFDLVLEKRQVRIDDIAATLRMNTSDALAIAEELQAEGEVELRENSTVIIPAKKYRTVRIPVEEWRSAKPDEILEQLADLVGRVEGHEGVAEALSAAIESIEQKLARGGTLVFEMRRAVSAWRTRPGNLDELRYTIREWRTRASTMS